MATEVTKPVSGAESVERGTNQKQMPAKGPSVSPAATARSGSIVGNTSLKDAVSELYQQHPHDYDAHGPHHGTDDHQRHMPLHGLKVTKKEI